MVKQPVSVSKVLFPVTYKCNLSCSFCKLPEVEIDLYQSLRNARKLRSIHNPEWCFITGGEPLIVSDIINVCDELRKTGYKVGLATNGTIDNDEIFDHIDRIGISIDGVGESHDRFRGSGVFASAVNMLKKAKQRAVETVILTTVVSENIGKLDKITGFVGEIKPTFWQLSRDVFNHDVVIPEVNYDNSIVINEYDYKCFKIEGERIVEVATSSYEVVSGTPGCTPPTAAFSSSNNSGPATLATVFTDSSTAVS